MSFKQYKPEQIEKIERLRIEAADEQLTKRKKRDEEIKWKAFFNLSIKAGDRVYVNHNGETTVGYILDVKNSLYKVSTPYGILKDIEPINIQQRNYKDLSGVVIPEALKKESTKVLLSALREHTITGHWYEDYETGPNPFSEYTEDQLRAELRTRPNIHSKRGGKILRQKKTKR